MEKVIRIGEKDIKMASTAGTLYRYRMQFKRDFMKDLAALDTALHNIQKAKENDQYAEFNVLQLEVFEQIAWSMAKTADKNIPEIDDWMDQFDTFDIYQALPQIMDIASSNFVNNKEKKNLVPVEVSQNH